MSEPMSTKEGEGEWPLGAFTNKIQVKRELKVGDRRIAQVTLFTSLVSLSAWAPRFFT